MILLITGTVMFGIAILLACVATVTFMTVFSHLERNNIEL